MVGEKEREGQMVGRVSEEGGAGSSEIQGMPPSLEGGPSLVNLSTDIY